MHEIARQRGVNVRYVYDLLRHGRAPTNMSIAAKLFCVTKSFSRLDLGDRRRKHIRWFTSLTRVERSQLIQLLYLNKSQARPHLHLAQVQVSSTAGPEHRRRVHRPKKRSPK